ncbi:protein ZNF783-like isoform X1 [Bufo gargarizans]|uniref:protein ZNF783-like isoform X1 n=1 Tax=Bufo gargarizans TaxID=30331 RepID=UPI001CF2292E|nr:protein ZNF783-like isoform X1 [Bufo gargarizans]XP_044144925.1 protein ZNF783-like isoform X1 [Bufo gargarizans]XP_044144926.1 protein ZNF783-like isoform X1 [Bufo gargarizans]
MDTSQRAAVSFTDVAASFSGEEWDILEEWQRHLYGNVMREIHNVLLDLGYHIENSEVLYRIVSKEETSKCGQRQEGLGPDIMLRINYQGAEVEDPEQRVIKTELDSLPEVKQEKGIYDTGVPDTSQDEGPRSTPGTSPHMCPSLSVLSCSFLINTFIPPLFAAMCTQSPSLPPGLVVYPVTVKKEAEDGGGDSQLSGIIEEWKIQS